jgi:glycosyltransferase involved in cell wall biosynthesis
MRILLLHQNFPGQFKFLAPALAAAGHRVVAMPMRRGEAAVWQGVQIQPYWPDRGSTPGVHPWLIDLETKAVRAQACAQQMIRLRDAGFEPDVVIAHPGWGESLGVKSVFPGARLGIYCEWYYRQQGADVNFDPEFAHDNPLEAVRLRFKNLNHEMHFEQADAALAPTHWQAGTFPEPFRQRIEVVHDGIDTVALKPDPEASLVLPGGQVLGRADEVVTFVSRNLEPYRGFHIFMRCLPALLRSRPLAQVLLVGGEGVSYGTPPADGRTWRAVLSEEVKPLLSPGEWSRVHFLGTLPHHSFITLLQVSNVHTYLTYPFVLSWSLLEAMSLGCAIVASDTPPVREVMGHNQEGRLVDFFDPQGLTQAICELLDAPAERQRLGQAARARARQSYDLKSVCLPAQLDWVRRLHEGAANLPHERT